MELTATNSTEATFLPLRIRRHVMADSNKTQYRVYRQGVEFITVEARSALEAFRVSGFAQAERIVRITANLFTSIERSELLESRDSIEVSFEGASSIVASGTAEPDEDDGVKPSALIPPPSRVGAQFLSEEGINNLLRADSESLAASASGELEGFDEILSMATPEPVRMAEPQMPRPAEPSAMPSEATAQPAAPAEPAKELSPEEVKALLGEGQ